MNSAGKSAGILAEQDRNQRALQVRDMFSRIAPRYDLMNRLMTVGQDIKWRKEVIRLADIPRGGRVLDLGAGTGDLAREAQRQCSDCRSIATDFTLEMMLAGKNGLADKGTQALSSTTMEESDSESEVDWVAADAQLLPYRDNSFDAIVSGFLARNLTDLPLSLCEQYRVLKPGGRIIILDTTPPPKNLLAPAIRFHLHTVIPALGGLIVGSTDAYNYLPDSTEQFLEPEMLAARLMSTGFRKITFRRFMLGTVAIHWGVKNE